MKRKTKTDIHSWFKIRVKVDSILATSNPSFDEKPRPFVLAIFVLDLSVNATSGFGGVVASVCTRSKLRRTVFGAFSTLIPRFHCFFPPGKGAKYRSFGTE